MILKRKKFIIIVSLFILFISFIISLTIGSYYVPAGNIIKIITDHIGLTDYNLSSAQENIIFGVRFPRIILALTVGACLSLSGVVYQGIFRNSLVDPFILGVSSGAAFGAALSIILSKTILFMQLFSFIFGLIAVGLTFALARHKQEDNLITFILGGIIIGSFFSAFVSVLKYIAPDSQLREIVFWLMGGFYYAVWQDVEILFPVFIVSFIVLWLLAWKLNILTIGDDEAKSLGVDINVLRSVFIVISTLIAALCVSLSGVIAWVGLMIPHASRLIIGQDNRYVIPFSVILGAIFMILCDSIARVISTGEIPVGIVTSILGGPYLLYLLRKKQ